MTKISDEAIARAFHEAYERLAPDFGYKTREASAKPWDEVPENNRALMTAVAGEVAPLIAAQALHAAAVELSGYADDDGINWARTFRNGLREAADYVRWIAEGRPAREPATRPGRCGDVAPSVLEPRIDAQLPPIICALPAGHAGWHRDERGAEWGRVDAP